jgi:hypothetical protein
MVGMHRHDRFHRDRQGTQQCDLRHYRRIQLQGQQRPSKGSARDWTHYKHRHLAAQRDLRRSTSKNLFHTTPGSLAAEHDQISLQGARLAHDFYPWFAATKMRLNLKACVAVCQAHAIQLIGDAIELLD